MDITNTTTNKNLLDASFNPNLLLHEVLLIGFTRCSTDLDQNFVARLPVFNSFMTETQRKAKLSDN